MNRSDADTDTSDAPPVAPSQSAASFRAHARTHTGLVRSANEDAYLERTDIALWAVADGMGGHDAGEVASKATVDALGATALTGTIQARAVAIEQTLAEVNESLREMASSRPGSVIGTTAVVLVTHAADAACVWAGDSRLYRVRDGHCTQLTEDHALVQELVRIGALKPEQARFHPAANLVTRALGADETLEPDVVFFELREDDMLVLASDGLSDDALASVDFATAASDDPERLADRLIAAALDDGGDDNVTIVCVSVGAELASD